MYALKRPGQNQFRKRWTQSPALVPALGPRLRPLRTPPATAPLDFWPFIPRPAYLFLRPASPRATRMRCKRTGPDRHHYRRTQGTYAPRSVWDTRLHAHRASSTQSGQHLSRVSAGLQGCQVRALPGRFAAAQRQNHRTGPWVLSGSVCMPSGCAWLRATSGLRARSPP
jgi:hypothetical protein